MEKQLLVGRGELIGDRELLIAQYEDLVFFKSYSHQNSVLKYTLLRNKYIFFLKKLKKTIVFLFK